MVKDQNRYLLDQISQELPTIAVGTCALLISSLSNQTFPRLVGRIVDDDRRGVSWNVAFVILGGGLASFVRTYTLQSAEERVAYRLSQNAFSSIMRCKSLEWFQQTTTSTTEKGVDNAPSDLITTPAAISTVLSDDVAKISKTLTISLANLVRSSSSVIFSTVNMLLLNPSLFAVAVSVVPLVGAAAMVLRKRIKKMDQEQGLCKAQLVSFVQERLIHVSMVRQCGRSADEVEHFSQRRSVLQGMAEKNSLQEGCWMGFLFSASSSALLLVVWMGGKAVITKRMTGGQLTSFSTYAFLLGLGTSGILKVAGEVTSGMVAADRFFALLDDKSDEVENIETSNVEDAKVLPHDVQALEMENVTFAYRNSEKPAIQNLTLKLEKGRVVALVGQNGSGKSTIAHILAGLYQPDTGVVAIHGTGWSTELGRLSQAKRHHIIQMIPQTSALFDLSILDNVRYGNPKASVLDARYALTKANCNDFVSRLPGGIDFVVGMNGLALARALLADPSILIMDEPMTSLDMHGVSAVADAVSSGRTLLLITHSPKTLELADTILVIRNGAIVEEGTFSALRSDPESQLCSLMPSVRC